MKLKLGELRYQKHQAMQMCFFEGASMEKNAYAVRFTPTLTKLDIARKCDEPYGHFKPKKLKKSVQCFLDCKVMPNRFVFDNYKKIFDNVEHHRKFYLHISNLIDHSYYADVLQTKTYLEIIDYFYNCSDELHIELSNKTHTMKQIHHFRRKVKSNFLYFENFLNNRDKINSFAIVEERPKDPITLKVLFDKDDDLTLVCKQPDKKELCHNFIE